MGEGTPVGGGIMGEGTPVGGGIKGEGTPVGGEIDTNCPPPTGGDRGGLEPIVINSGYRSPQLNKKIGGAASSNHLTGCAADIRVSGMEQALRYATILLDISDESQEPFDELLLEHKGCSCWVHFAVRPTENRRRIKFINI